MVGILFLWVGHISSNENESMTIVRNIFPGHLISRFGDVPLPPRSPDLSTCDFFLWGYLKSRVYTHKHRTLNGLKEAFRQEIRPIDRQLLAGVMDDFKKMNTASKKTVVILQILFLKLNHLVWHVLSFNFI